MATDQVSTDSAGAAAPPGTTATAGGGNGRLRAGALGLVGVLLWRPAGLFARGGA